MVEPLTDHLARRSGTARHEQAVPLRPTSPLRVRARSDETGTSGTSGTDALEADLEQCRKCHFIRKTCFTCARVTHARKAVNTGEAALVALQRTEAPR